MTPPRRAPLHLVRFLAALLVAGMAASCGSEATEGTTGDKTTGPDDSPSTDAAASSSNGAGQPTAGTPDAGAASPGPSAPSDDAGSPNDDPPPNDAATSPPFSVSPECQACVDNQCGPELEACACQGLITCALDSGCLALSSQAEVITCALGSCGQLLPADLQQSYALVLALAGCVERECLASCP